MYVRLPAEVVVAEAQAAGFLLHGVVQLSPQSGGVPVDTSTACMAEAPCAAVR